MSETTQMTDEKHHRELIDGLYNQMKQIMESSQQPIFIYLDDNHKVCNKKFASFLGYSTPDEWANIQGFLEVYVDEVSRETLSSAYWSAVNNFNASTVKMVWRRKDKTTVNSNMILVPIIYSGHTFAIHFII